MISLEACEAFFQYVGKSVTLDEDTRKLIADYTTEVTFPKKHIIIGEKFFLDGN